MKILHRRSWNVRSIVTITARGLCFGLLAASLTSHQVIAANDAAQLSEPGRPLPAQEVAAAQFTAEALPAAAHRPQWANFERERASHEARHVADWVVDSGDNRGMPFAIVDKTDAKVFVFGPDGRLRGAAPALLGLALGDDS